MILSNQLALNTDRPVVRNQPPISIEHLSEARPVSHIRPSFQIRRAFRWLKLHLGRTVSYLVKANQDAADLHNRIYNEKEQYFARYGYYIRGIH